MRRIKASDQRVYQVRPSFLMPYQVGFTAEVEKGLYMYFSGASFEQVVHNHGHNPMYWWRIMTSLGRNELVGTTVKSPEKLPEHLLADEKHTWWYKDTVYLATTIGGGCILGACLAAEASEKKLLLAYQEFEAEARSLNPAYSPVTVNTDGWRNTRSLETALRRKSYFDFVFFTCCTQDSRTLSKMGKKKRIDDQSLGCLQGTDGHCLQSENTTIKGMGNGIT